MCVAGCIKIAPSPNSFSPEGSDFFQLIERTVIFCSRPYPAKIPARIRRWQQHVQQIRIERRALQTGGRNRRNRIQNHVHLRDQINVDLHFRHRRSKSQIRRTVGQREHCDPFAGKMFRRGPAEHLLRHCRTGIHNRIASID